MNIIKKTENFLLKYEYSKSNAFLGTVLLWLFIIMLPIICILETIALYFNSLMFQPDIEKILIYVFMIAAMIPHLLQFFTFKKFLKENILKTITFPKGKN